MFVIFMVSVFIMFVMIRVCVMVVFIVMIMMIMVMIIMVVIIMALIIPLIPLAGPFSLQFFFHLEEVGVIIKTSMNLIVTIWNKVLIILFKLRFAKQRLI